jgi:hypothetical protein
MSSTYILWIIYVIRRDRFFILFSLHLYRDWIIFISFDAGPRYMKRRKTLKRSLTTHKFIQIFFFFLLIGFSSCRCSSFTLYIPPLYSCATVKFFSELWRMWVFLCSLFFSHLLVEHSTNFIRWCNMSSAHSTYIIHKFYSILLQLHPWVYNIYFFFKYYVTIFLDYSSLSLKEISIHIQ